MVRLLSKKNKEKLLANIILNKFLRKIVLLNIISFAKTREIIVKEGSIINYGNCHLAINNIVDISKLV